jgi:hypothetical protein
MPAVRTPLTISHPDTWIPLPRCSHGNHGYCGFCATEHLPRCSHGNHGFCGFCFSERETPFDDMNWAPEGGDGAQQGAGRSDEDATDDEDLGFDVQQWNEENEEDDDDMDWTPLSPYGSPTTSYPRHHLYSSS